MSVGYALMSQPDQLKPVPALTTVKIQNATVRCSLESRVETKEWKWV